MYSEFGFVIGITLALSIGATSAGMAVGRTRPRWASMVLVALFYVAGALLLGPRSIHTVGTALFTATPANPYLVLLIAPGAALVLLTLAMLFKLPLAATHVAVASLAAVGLSLDVLNAATLGVLFAWWLLTPVAAFVVTYVLVRLVPKRPPNGLTLCLIAFTIGASGAANSTAFLSTAGLLSPTGAAALAGVGMAAGALIWGRRNLGQPRSLTVALVSASIMLTAAVAGVPISLTLVIASAIVANGLATRRSPARPITVLLTSRASA